MSVEDEESASEASSTVIPITPLPETAAMPQAPVYVVPSYMPTPQTDQIYATQFQAPVYYVDQYGRPIQPVYAPQQWGACAAYSCIRQLYKVSQL